MCKKCIHVQLKSQQPQPKQPQHHHHHHCVNNESIVINWKQFHDINHQLNKQFIVKPKYVINHYSLIQLSYNALLHRTTATVTIYSNLLVSLCILLMICTHLSVAMTTGKRISNGLINNTYQFLSSKLLRNIGEEILRNGGVITQLLDAIEFSVVHERSTSYLNIQYFIGHNRSLWFTITPCTNVLNRIEFIKSSAYHSQWNESNVYGLELSKSEIYSMNWSQQKIHIEPFPNEVNPPNFTLINYGYTILGISRSRVHFAQNDYKADSLNIRIYGEIGDAYNIRLSTRQSPIHALDGYPQLDKSSVISVCLVQNTNDTLDITWKRVTGNLMQINYCLVINTIENLYYECTALARLNQLNNSMTTNELLKRPKIFQDTDYLRSTLIDHYVYQCSRKSMIRIRLTPTLTKIMQQLHMNHSLKLFINVYAINQRIDISTAYPVHIVQYTMPICQTQRPINKIKVVYEPYTNKLLWNSDVTFEITINDKSTQLYYQPCYLPSNKSIDYTISLLKKSFIQNSNRTLSNLIELCKYSINNPRLLRLCLTDEFIGEYHLQLNGNANFQNGQPVGRYFFLKSNTTNLFPQKPKHTYYPTDISLIISQPSINQTIFQIPSSFIEYNTRQYRYTNLHRIKRYYQQSIIKMKSNQINNYYMKTVTTTTPDPLPPPPRPTPSTTTSSSSSSSSRSYNDSNNERLRNDDSYFKRYQRHVSLRNGFEIGVECTLHQVYISLKISINPQNYWIYTLPLMNDPIENRNSVLDYINNNMTNYCEFPLNTLTKQMKYMNKLIYCQTLYGMTSLDLTLPIYHRNDYPRFYLILIYTSNDNDINGVYKQLYVRQLLDACYIISYGCYTNVPIDCHDYYPNYFPSTFDLFMSTSMILTLNASNHIPICMIDEF